MPLPPVTLTLLLATVAASLFGFVSRRAFDAGALHPYGMAHDGTWYQTVTSGFLHADFGHLAFNMITLFFFGPFVEARLGSAGFLIVYFGSLVAGSLLTYLRKRGDTRYRAIGASGAISGVLFGFVLMRPLEPIYLFLIPVGIPATLFAIGYVLVSLFGMRRGLGRIGHDAHLGGALAGFVITLVLEPALLPHFLAEIRSAF